MNTSRNKSALLPRLHDDASYNLLLKNETYAKENKLMDASLLSPCIEITGYDMPVSMMVPMVNREEEMRHIVQRNPGYFIQVQQQVDDEKTFEKLKSTLYAPRQILSDQDWLWRIEKLLTKLSPALWERFQALIDYFPTINPTKSDSSESASSTTPPTMVLTDSPTEAISRNSSSSSSSSSSLSSSHLLTARPPLLAQLKEQHEDRESASGSTATSSTSSFRYLYDDHGFFFDPRIRHSKTWQKDLDAFLQECKLAMKADAYHRFIHWLFASPSKVTDANWESALYESLNYYPILFLKLKDWIDHQVE
ncbi:hypothetical protein BCR42DRAFT_425679 [Absidia repens]|uniref:Uncharacterized protein n=1 Tax=Absidia repens TaxID=90262 RepID=A0A1X2I2G8_9FUNG|nr:hypothetical protein BCR42DRAFT_425679 [Absidia repens]